MSGMALMPGQQMSYKRLADWAKTAPADQLQTVYGQARDLHKRAWIYMAITCGVASERTEGALTGSELAQTFDVSAMQVSRHIRIYSQILQPRIELQGENAEFSLWEEHYFHLALDAARHVADTDAKLSALQFIEMAEDGGFPTPTSFKAHLIAHQMLPGDDGSTDVNFRAAGPAGKVLKAVVTLSSVDDEVKKEVLEKMADMDLDVGTRIGDAIEFLGYMQSERDRAVASHGEGKARATA